MKNLKLLVFLLISFLFSLETSNAAVTANGVEIRNEGDNETILSCFYSDDYWFTIDGTREPIDVDVPLDRDLYDLLPFTTLMYDELRGFGILSDNGWDCPAYITIDNNSISGFSNTQPSGGSSLSLDTSESFCQGTCNQVVERPSSSYACNYTGSGGTMMITGENNRCTVIYPDGTQESMVNGVCSMVSSTSCPDLYYDSSTREIMWASYDYNQWFENSPGTYDPEMQNYLCGDDSQVSYYCSEGGCEYPNNQNIQCDRIESIIENERIYADRDVYSICSSPSYRKPMLFLGKILNFVKIIVPIVIIVFGVLDFYKAITSSKDEGLSKAFKSLIIRAIAGVCIFLLPGIVQLVLNMVNEWSDYSNNWCCCTECLLNGDCDVNSCSSDSCRIEGMD